MYVCICNKVNEAQVSQAVRQGADSLDKLEAVLGVGNCCGKCQFRANRVLQQNLGSCEFVDAMSMAMSG